MPTIIEIIVLTTLAGLAMPVGAIVATVEHIQPKWLESEFRHSVVAFGGGVLVSAVALVLVPEGADGFSLPWVVFWFLAGGVAFLGLDVLLSINQRPASQLVAMLADFVPEAIALGAGFALGEPTGVLLALLIALQNLPEGFNACRELLDSGRLPGRQIVLIMTLLATLGPISGLVGYFWLGAHPQAVKAVMLFAAAGILYLIFQDIAPQVKLDHRQAPALGAVLGFLCGLMGQLLTVHG